MAHIGKIQKNQYGNYMLVETNRSSNRFIGNGFRAEISNKPLTDEEIIDAYNIHVKPPTISEMKGFLGKTEGFCWSNCTGDGFTYGDIFKLNPAKP